MSRNGIVQIESKQKLKNVVNYICLVLRRQAILSSQTVDPTHHSNKQHLKFGNHLQFVWALNLGQISNNVLCVLSDRICVQQRQYLIDYWQMAPEVHHWFHLQIVV